MKYALLLNDMRSSNIENIQVVKMSGTKEELVNYYKSLLVEPYIDEGVPHNWNKTFKRGSELEWFNPVHNLDRMNDYWGGIWEVNDNTQIGEGLTKW